MNSVTLMVTPQDNFQSAREPVKASVVTWKTIHPRQQFVNLTLINLKIYHFKGYIHKLKEIILLIKQNTLRFKIRFIFFYEIIP